MANGEGGFTLIELLIVIVVLGILAAIVVFALGGVTAQSAVASCTSDAKTVSIAVSAYEAQNNGNAPAAPAFTFNSDGSVKTESETDLVPTYLKSWPSNPSYYQITLDSTGNVEVALAQSDTDSADVGTGTPLSAGTPNGYVVPEEYEGSSIFAFTSADGATGTLIGQGIRQGA